MFKLFRKKKTVETPDARYQVAKSKVDSAFKMFKDAKKALEDANAELQSAIVEHAKNIESHEAKLTAEHYAKARAQDEMNANNALASKITDFIPQ